MKKILVIDDDEDLRSLVEIGLKQEGFQVHTAQDGPEGLRLAFSLHPDLVILDIMMPGMSGLDTCRRLRELSDLPIIMLTALSSEADVIKGLASGADDYIHKPFGMAELIARVNTCLRRGSASEASPVASVLSLGDLTIDLARHQVLVRNECVNLSPTEFHLLAYLARNRNRIVPHRTLLREVWGPEYTDQMDYLHLYVRYLRQKVERDPSHPEIIKTERGVGYYIDEA